MLDAIFKALGSLLDLRRVLEGISTLAKCIYDNVDGCGQRPNLRVDHSVRAHFPKLCFCVSFLCSFTAWMRWNKCYSLNILVK